MDVLKDLDGCSFDFGRNLWEGLPKIGIPNDDLPAVFDRWDFFNEWPGWDDAKFIEVCHQLADAGHLFVGKADPGAVEAWQRIADAGHRIHVVTHRGFGGADGQPSRNATLRYLLDEGFPFHSVTFSGDKTVVRCDAGLEDNLGNYDALDAAGCEVWLIDRPWNRDPGDQRRRVRTVGEFADIILAKG